MDAVESLRSLNAPVDHWDYFLVPLIVKGLDQSSLMAWEESVDKSMEPSKFSDLINFLTKRLLTLEDVHGSNSQSSSESSSCKSNISTKQKTIGFHNAVQRTENSGKLECSFCKQSHYISSCSSYKSKPLNERLLFVTNNRLCFNCLGHHNVSNC